MKLTPSETTLLGLIRDAGGSYCPGNDATITPEVHRLLRKMARRGVLHVEETDDGPRFTVAYAAHA
jgi:predicted transcriptional regulator